MAPATGSGYETTLKTVAARLVSQLELAHQKSGTVLDFTDLQGQGTELGRFLAQELSDQLVSEAKSFSLVDRVNLQYLLKENKLSMEGLIDPDTSRKLGNMIGIDTIIIGTVTPIGQSIRLSVRAIAVETGKIIASQSTSLPAGGGLGDLYSHGVSSVSTASLSSPATATVRDRLRADSFKFFVTELFVSNVQFAGQNAALNFSIENHSGIGVGLAVRAGGISAGPCTPSAPNLAGLMWINDSQITQLMNAPNPSRLLRWFPPGARVSGTISMPSYDCYARMVSGISAVPVTVNFVVAAGKDVIVLPLNVEKAPVRVMQ
jgi:hypothetical protein